MYKSIVDTYFLFAQLLLLNGLVIASIAYDYYNLQVFMFGVLNIDWAIRTIMGQ